MASATAKKSKARQPKDADPIAAMAPRERSAFEISKTLPDSEPELQAVALAAIKALDAAVLAYDDEAAEAAEARYNAVVWKLNGGTFFGSIADETSPGRVLEARCAAQLGEVPMWHQSGEFLIDVGGMRARVAFRPFANSYSVHFHALDIDAPFMSETGFLSTFTKLVGGTTVLEAVERIACAEIKARGSRFIKVSSRPRLREEVADSWAAALVDIAPTAPPPVFVDKGGQMAFAF